MQCYSNAIRSYKDELIFIGVQIRDEDISNLIVRSVVHLASSKMSVKLVFLVLYFLRYLKGENKLDEHLRKSLQEGKWLKSLQGYASPMGSIFLTSGEDSIGQIVDMPIVDRMHYGSKLIFFQVELNFLGVVVGREELYKLIPLNFRFPQDPSSLTSDAALMLLKCMKFIGPADFGLSLRSVCNLG